MEHREDTDGYEFSDITAKKLRKYRNLIKKIQDDPQCREIESKLSKVMTLNSKIDYIESLLEEREST